MFLCMHAHLALSRVFLPEPYRWLPFLFDKIKLLADNPPEKLDRFHVLALVKRIISSS